MACALVLFAISLFVTFFPEWFKMTNYDGNWGGKLMVRKGLWVKCTRVSPGMHNCDRIGSKAVTSVYTLRLKLYLRNFRQSYLSAIFGLPGYIVATRGATILALSANLGTICSLFFVNFYSAKHKRLIIRVGGGLIIFGENLILKNFRFTSGLNRGSSN